MDILLFSSYGVEFLLRWVHFLAGITWIGLLYYFNLVQGEWFKEAGSDVKSAAIAKLVPRALWWFRWGAMVTFLSGAAILWMRMGVAGLEIWTSSWGITIALGAVLGTLMFLNVWLVIWPNQKIVIASAPFAAKAQAKAGLASRTNMLFSLPMLFFMGAASHFGMPVRSESRLGVFAVLVALILLLLEWNALKGKLGPLTTIPGVIASGVLLTAVFYTLAEVLL
ncbi:MAG: urate hydroxylase PuuD [Gammaproteobacteria bacterium]|nr:urate hydroxylase PuuD [Gammaproteobacteria bacterium]